MGCGSSGIEDKEGKARNDAIDASIKQARQNSSVALSGEAKLVAEADPHHALQRSEVKMLLLGAGESGKSTVLKQMKLRYAGDYDQAEREDFKDIIYANTLQSMTVILDAMDMMDIHITPKNEEAVRTFRKFPALVEGEKPPMSLFNCLSALWHDEGLQEAFRRRREYQLNDSASYYFESIERPENPMSSPTWIPDPQDVLRSRVKTTGITETTFRVGDLVYKLFDVGGQRSERKKWIHCFENVTAIVFLVAISEYDQKLYEDESVNRLNEALGLFNSICNSRWFVKTSIILFLNKIDLFREKLAYSPFSQWQPEYQGSDTDYHAARQYIYDRFNNMNVNRESKTIYAHFTCATDTQNIRFVLSAVNDIVIQANLRDCGLL